MKRILRDFIVLTLSVFLLIGCGDSYLGVEQVVVGSNPPEKVTVKDVVSKSGALEIHFSLPPGNPNIDQVVASYKNKKGEKMEFKVSRYSSSILVEGFTGTDEKAVELICVDVSGNKSEVTMVNAAPLLSPLELAYQTINVEPAFGGVRLDWENGNANPLAIHVLTEDMLQLGVITLVEDPTKTIYNRDSVNTFAFVRQYPSIEQKFGFTVSDKWGNRSDTLVSTLIPYKEEEIDWRSVMAISFFNPTLFNGSRDYGIYGVNAVTGIQNDANAHASGNAPQKMFNGVPSGNEYYGYKFVKNLSNTDPSKRETVHDVYATFDLNMEARLNRVKISPRVHISYTYARSSPKRFRIWGTNDSNGQRWAKFPETWTLIGEYVGRTPVNLAALTQEELDWFNLNQEYLINEDNVNPDAKPTAPFRYMRLQLMESYNKNEAFYTINEFQMFGEVLQKF